MMHRWVIAAVAAAVLAAGCAQTGDQRTPQQSQSAADEPSLIGDRADARVRAKAHTDLAAAYYEVGNMGVALEEARIALAADPNYAPAHNVMGLVNFELRDNAGAEANFKRATALAPQDPDVAHNYGFFLCRTGREQEGLQQYMTAIRNPLYQNPAKTWAAAGRCVEPRDTALAEQYYDRALKLDPNTLGAMMPYAQIQYRRGSMAEARNLVGRYQKLVEPTAESLWLGVRVERKLGDRIAENNYATQLRRRFPNSKEYQDYLRGNFD
jgi:type IV pilus assembly protein PilF